MAALISRPAQYTLELDQEEYDLIRDLITPVVLDRAVGAGYYPTYTDSNAAERVRVAFDIEWQREDF